MLFRPWVRMLVAFGTGYIVAANLSKLGFGEHYEAAWYKVGLALVIFGFFCLYRDEG